MRKPSKKTLRRKCDALFSKLIRERDGNRCVKCGNPHPYLHCAHIISRSNLNMRYNLSNALSLCPSCHVYGINAAHRNPIHFAEWLRRELGEDTYANLLAESQKIKKIYPSFWQETYDRLKKEET